MAGISIEQLIAMEDMDALSKETQGNTIPTPPTVNGRIAHIDGDYLAYIVAADRKDQPPTTLPQAKKHLQDFVDQLIKYSGSTDYVIHLTEGDKGGRFEQAKLKEYQANRNYKEKPLLLGDVRRHIAESEKSYVCTVGEADDSMAMALHQATINDREEYTVLISQDKDLNMVKGWHLDWSTSQLYYVDTLGSLTLEVKHKPERTVFELDEETGEKVERVIKASTTKKMRGVGGLWFFAQLLRGDTADNISGLPKFSGRIMNVLKPTKAVTTALGVIKDPKSKPAKVLKAFKTLKDRKAGACGDVSVYEYLKDCKTLKEAYTAVIRAYISYDETNVIDIKEDGTEVTGFMGYEGEQVSMIDAFESECRLLYMRHNLDSEDFRLFLNDILIKDL